jgi:competence protein ComGF
MFYFYKGVELASSLRESIVDILNMSRWIVLETCIALVVIMEQLGINEIYIKGYE